MAIPFPLPLYMHTVCVPVCVSLCVCVPEGALFISAYRKLKSHFLLILVLSQSCPLHVRGVVTKAILIN